jgi:nucleoside diphosphate kinase
LYKTWSEIRKENKSLDKSPTAKSEAAHDKIREDFEIRLNSEVVIVSENIDNVGKGMSTTIDEVYASVSDKIDRSNTDQGRN